MNKQFALLMSVIGFGLVLSFQNCSKIQFETLSAGQLVKKVEDEQDGEALDVEIPLPQEVAEELEQEREELYGPDVDPPPPSGGSLGDGNPPPATPPIVSDPMPEEEEVVEEETQEEEEVVVEETQEEEEVVVTRPGNNNAGGNNDGDHGGGSCKDREPPVDPDSDAGQAIQESGETKKLCILEGSGNSEKLGLKSGSVSSVNAVSKAVCISANACLNLVSQKFDVKGTGTAGPCNENPNVIYLSDEQVVTLVDNYNPAADDSEEGESDESHNRRGKRH